MSKVVQFRTARNPDDVLEQAVGQMTHVLVIGYSEDGELDIRASLNVNNMEANWMLDHCKIRVLGMED